MLHFLNALLDYLASNLAMAFRADMTHTALAHAANILGALIGVDKCHDAAVAAGTGIVFRFDASTMPIGGDGR